MRFALITEGVSEHRIIKHILEVFFKDHDPEINQIQPKMINEKQESIGGWNEVLKYCERSELEDILVENDYLVIQIDTDQSQQEPFNVSHTNSSNDLKTVNELCNDVVIKLESLIQAQIIEEYKDKIVFAICIHTIECWLLPIYFTDHHKSDTRNCFSTLNRQLRKMNLSSIPPSKNTPTAIRAYGDILKSWRRKKNLLDSAKHNDAFQKFIDTLDDIPLTQNI